MQEHNSLMNKDGVGDILALKKKDEELLKINEDATANSISDNTKMEALSSDKQNKASLLDGNIKQQDQHYTGIKEQQKNDYAK